MSIKRIMRIRKSMRNASLDELQELARWCEERAQIIIRRAKEKAIEDAWCEISVLPVGSMVFSHLDVRREITSWRISPSGIASHPLAVNMNLFGMPLRVQAKDATHIWLSYSLHQATNVSRAVAFTRDNILNYSIKTYPPVEAVTAAILANTQS